MLERDDNETEYEVNEWMRFGLRLGVSTALHPFEYAKVLMQVSCKTFPVLLAGIDRGFSFYPDWLRTDCPSAGTDPVRESDHDPAQRVPVW